ncbi:MAG: DMT family transporter [Alphaproteobacteria bacterium]|nr:DMT family transporter [Rhodospirillaceae bacterium]MBT6509284.1 DMT family transporter [Rhodospirillaceae bacterium]MBT7613650.1 DMT family transporter [Rhodospirillaceae bacterium]MBT7647886.1 DMT family transporter [Rhodospirillaceae bacterium]MDG2482430.1 DMT family transporter [Alphaproteobacteria bacterium]
MSETTVQTAAHEAARVRHDNLSGAGFVVAAAVGFTVVSVLVKALGQTEIDVFQITVIRSVLGLCLLLPLFWRARLVPWRTQHLKIHLARAGLGGTAVLTGYYAFMKLPLAEVTSISFTVPLFVTVAAVIFLGEIVGWRRWSATAMGFAGVLVVARPFDGAVELATLLAVGMAVCIAFSVVLLKRFPARESQLTMLFFFLVISGLMAIGPAISSWHQPSTDEWLLLGGVAVMGLISQALVIRGFRLGEASFVAPFDYVRLLFAGAAGVFFFAEVPDGWTYAGSVLIIGSTLYIARREAILAKQGSAER